MNLEELKNKIREWEAEAMVSQEEVEFYWRPVKVTFHRGGDVREYVIHFPWREDGFAVEEMVLQDPIVYGHNMVKSDISMVQEPLAHQLKETQDIYTDEDTAEVLPETEVINTAYTKEDYLVVSSCLRIELLDGRFYYMSGASTPHQIFVGELYRQFANYIEEKEGKCEAMPSPVDVLLTEEEETMLQPDVIIVCEEDKIEENRVNGAPDLVVEVHSPSTKNYDIKEKLQRYRMAGVREYWMVDIKKECITVCDFAGGGADTIYGVHEMIPVRIYDGECKVDLEKIWRKIWRLQKRWGEKE